MFSVASWVITFIKDLLGLLLMRRCRFLVRVRRLQLLLFSNYHPVPEAGPNTIDPGLTMNIH